MNVNSLKMAQLVARSLISCPEAYLQALKCFYSSIIEPRRHPTSECIEKHVSALISDYVGELLREHSPFCVLGVGSGDGVHDLFFIEMLSKTVPRERSDDKCKFFQRSIEPDENVLRAFRDKAEDLPESLKSIAEIEFKWCPMTFQDYVEQKKQNDVQFDVVDFFHSLYYVGLETALKHCYDRELGAKGVIVCTIGGDSAMRKYYDAFAPRGLILNPGSYYNSKDVTDVAKKNGWKYVECPGDPTTFDITAIFDRSSVEGSYLLDFLTQWANIRLTASQENLEKILNFWADECTEDGQGRKIIIMPIKTVLILKGM